MLAHSAVVNLCHTHGSTPSKVLPGTKSLVEVAPVLSPLKVIEPPKGSVTSDNDEQSSFKGPPPRAVEAASGCHVTPGAVTTGSGWLGRDGVVYAWSATERQIARAVVG